MSKIIRSCQFGLQENGIMYIQIILVTGAGGKTGRALIKALLTFKTRLLNSQRLLKIFSENLFVFVIIN